MRKKIIQGLSCLKFVAYGLMDVGNKERRGFLLRVRPYTKVAYDGLKSTWDLVIDVEQRELEGSLVECGVWRGGAAAVMAYLTQKHGKNRELHLFDSFEGLPEPSKEDGGKAVKYAECRIEGKLKPIGKCIASLDEVKEVLFSVFKLDKERIHFHQGWFQKTLVKAKKKVGKIAVLRVDADWYESTKLCLDNLYDQVVKEGYVVIDDYHFWPGCRKAVEEFRLKRKIKNRLQRTGSSGVYWQK